MQSTAAGLWRQPDFLKLWVGQTVSEFGSRITRDGLPLAAVLVLGANPIQMALLAAMASAPVFIVGLFAGVWVDRLPRRPILIWTDLARASLLITIPVAALLGLLRIEQLYLVAGLVGILTVFFDVAYQSYLPFLVQRDNLVDGNSKLAMSSSLAEIGGPALAGGLVQLATAPIAILLDAFSFLFSAFSLAFIKTKERPSGEGVQWKGGITREIGAGLKAVLDMPVLRALMASSATFHFFGGFFGALYYYFAVRELGLSAGVLGLLIASGGIGALLGALVVGRVSRRFGTGPTTIVSLLLTGGLYLLVPLAGGPEITAIGLIGAAQLFGDLTWTIVEVNTVSLRQAITPDRLLGRVNASTQVVEAALGTIGLLAGGVLGETFGSRPILLVAAVGISLASVWLLLSPVRALREQPLPSGVSEIAD